MKTPPPLTDLDPRDLSVMTASRWGLPPLHLAYQAVGFGSHHWRADADDGSGRRWFVTVDACDEDSGTAVLERALRTAAAVRDPEGGAIAEVAAPLPDRQGAILATLSDGRWAVALYPWLDAEPSQFGAFASETDRSTAQRLIARVHAATARIPEHLPDRDDLAIPHRAELEAAMTMLDASWTAGPYGEPARTLLGDALGSMIAAFAAYGRLGAAVRADAAVHPWVVTHGEPHAGNIVRLHRGGMAVVDWDTCKLAPRERDLWHLLPPDDDPTTGFAAYREVAGDIPISADALALYRLQWDLSEVAIYTRWFTTPHADTEDMRIGFGGLGESLERLGRAFS